MVQSGSISNIRIAVQLRGLRTGLQALEGSNKKYMGKLSTKKNHEIDQCGQIGSLGYVEFYV